MKRKSSRMWALSLLALAPCATLSMALHGANPANADYRQPQVMQLPDVAVPNTSEVKEISRLYSSLPDIARPGEEETAAVDLQLFGYRKVEKVVTPAERTEKSVQDAMTYHLSFAFYSDRLRFCIIDKTIYTEGKELPDGARVLKIESRRILLDQNGHEEWIFMQEAHNRARDVKLMVQQ
jgi:hypothetical protein